MDGGAPERNSLAMPNPSPQPVTVPLNARLTARIGSAPARRRLAAVESLDPLKVVVADAHALVRAGLCALLEQEDDMTVIAQASDAEQAWALARRLRPEVLLVDMSLPPLGGVAAVARIAQDPQLADLNVVIVVSSDSENSVLDALRAGVRGVVLRDAHAADLAVAVRTVARGDGMLSPRVTRRLIEEFAAIPDGDRPRPEQLEDLTPREVEVVALVASGLSNREIAERLVVTPATAKTHVSRALRKVNARDRAQLVTLAYETGLVVPRPSSSEPALVAV
jgi:DNA-binding NarL/FixJ family response regulator